MTIRFPQDIDQFLSDYWQQKPCLIKQAYPDFDSPIAADQLAGLACLADVESRLVSGEHHQPPAWRLQHGPFEDQDFLALGEENWTLLVQDVDKFVPEVGNLLDDFRFLPDWRLDDIMISFAVPGGSVGPHTDQYDVFLLQTLGRRRWQLDLTHRHDDNLIDDLDLSIMAEFQADIEWVLEPGDMLYLPPKIGHYGVALDTCMTYSIGFRAPDFIAMTESVLHDFHQQHFTEVYSDPGRPAETEPYLLEEIELNLMYRQAVSAMPTEHEFKSGIMAYLTQGKFCFDEQIDLAEDWQNHAFLRPHSARFLYRRVDQQRLEISLAGLNANLFHHHQRWLDYFVQQQPLACSSLLTWAKEDGIEDFITTAVITGRLVSS